METTKSINQLTQEQLSELTERYPWFGCAQRRLAMTGGKVKDSYLVPRLMRNSPVVAQKTITADEFDWSNTDKLIDEFILSGEHKVVATDQTPDTIDDIDDHSTIESADDDFVTEELAEIYVKQQLYEQAIQTYRRLSLLDPKKSVYFAKIIEDLQKNTNN